MTVAYVVVVVVVDVSKLHYLDYRTNGGKLSSGRRGLAFDWRGGRSLDRKEHKAEEREGHAAGERRKIMDL